MGALLIETKFGCIIINTSSFDCTIKQEETEETEKGEEQGENATKRLKKCQQTHVFHSALL